MFLFSFLNVLGNVAPLERTLIFGLCTRRVGRFFGMWYSVRDGEDVMWCLWMPAPQREAGRPRHYEERRHRARPHQRFRKALSRRRWRQEPGAVMGGGISARSSSVTPTLDTRGWRTLTIAAIRVVSASSSTSVISILPRLDRSAVTAPMSMRTILNAPSFAVATPLTARPISLSGKWSFSLMMVSHTIYPSHFLITQTESGLGEILCICTILTYFPFSFIGHKWCGDVTELR